MTKRRGLLRKAGPEAAWNVADQALASLTTFAVTIIAARAGDATEFGHFAVGLTVYLFLLGVSQALVNQVYLMRFPAVPAEQAREGARAATGLTVVFGAACTLVVVPVALLVPGGAGPAVVTIAALFPVLFTQEAVRAVLIARRRARSATLNDALRATLQIGAVAALVGTGRSAPAELLLAWGLAGGAAAAVGAWQIGALPAPALGLRFARRHLDITRFLVAEWLLVLGAAQLGLLVVALLGSTADVGSLRGAQTLLGPLNILGLGVFGFLLTELVRRPGLADRRRRQVAAGAGAVLAAITFGWGFVLLALPTPVGTALLGATWSGTRTTLLPMTIYLAGAAAATGVLAVLRAAGDARSTFGVNAVLGPLMLATVCIGQLAAGAVGAAWGFAAATTLVVPLFWLRMERLFRRETVVPS